MSKETSLICVDCKVHITVGKLPGLYRLNVYLDDLEEFLKDHAHTMEEQHHLVYWEEDDWFPVELKEFTINSETEDVLNMQKVIHDRWGKHLDYKEVVKFWKWRSEEDCAGWIVGNDDRMIALWYDRYLKGE